MKTFERTNIISQLDTTNEYGEHYHLVLDSDNRVWFYHEDCNEDYQEIFNHRIPYILSPDEMKKICDFFTEIENNN